jgi:hypothetical protein
MHDRGQPTIIIHERTGTPEEIAQNRERLRTVCEKIASRVNGRPMCVELTWPPKEIWMSNGS